MQWNVLCVGILDRWIDRWILGMSWDGDTKQPPCPLQETKAKALQEELENPMNVHRWRELEVRCRAVQICNFWVPLLPWCNFVPQKGRKVKSYEAGDELLFYIFLISVHQNIWAVTNICCHLASYCLFDERILAFHAMSLQAPWQQWFEVMPTESPLQGGPPVISRL